MFLKQEKFKSRYLPFLWLFLGSFLIIFTRTKTFIPIAIIVAPVLFLRFIRSQKPVRGIILTFLGYIVAIQIAQWGLFELDKLLLYLIINVRGNLILAIILAFPYIADRLLKPYIKGFLATLIFPVAAVSLYYLETLFGPINTIGIFYAFTQYGNLPLVQFMSIAGIWGMIFFIYWTAAVVNWIWENKADWVIIKRGFAIYCTITVLIFLYGGIKTSALFFKYKGQTVRIAAIPMPVEPDENDYNMFEIFNNRIFSEFDRSINKIEKQIKKAVIADAKFAVFQEYSMYMPEAEEERLISELKRIAEENDIYICFNYGCMPELEDRVHKEFFGIMELSDNEEGRNKSVLINNRGKVEAEYLKVNLATGENNWILEGSDGPPVVDTPYGRIGIVTCRDMSLPAYMRQVARKNVDVVFAPSFEAIKSLSVTYTQMLRAVENGFAFVRPCNKGLSIAIDKHGRVIASLNNFISKNLIMYADIPMNGTRTVYSYIGDLFAWLMIITLIGMIGFVIKTKKGK